MSTPESITATINLPGELQDGSMTVNQGVVTEMTPPVNATAESTPEDFIDIVFDGPPDHNAGRFVEVEDSAGKSIRVGEWIRRPDHYWALRIPKPATDELKLLLREAREHVFNSQPGSYDEAEAKDDLLARIDAAAPAPSPPDPVSAPLVFCEKIPGCTLVSGHDGDCDDDLPF